MPSLDTIIAQGVQPTTPWKSPAAMEQEQQALVNSKVINQANQLKVQQEQQAMQAAQRSQQAWARAAQEAGPDPDKFLTLGVQYGGTPEEQMKFRAGFDTSAKAHSELDKEKQALSEAHNNSIIGALESVPLAGNDPIAQAYQYKVALSDLKRRGIDTSHLPEAHPGPGMLTGIINSHGMAGSAIARAKAQQDADIARLTEERAQADQAIQEAQAKVEAQKAPFEIEKLRNESLAGVVDPATGMTRSQALQFEQGKFTPDQKDYDRAVKDGAIDPTKTNFVDYQKMLANLKNPSVQVNVNGKPLAESAINKLDTLANNAAKLQGLQSTFKDDFVGNTFTGDMENFLAGKGLDLGMATEGQFDWWQDYREFVNQVRKELFGSALTNTEGKEFDRIIINPSMDPKIAKTNLARQAQLAKKALQHRVDVYKAGGANKDQLSEYEVDIQPENKDIKDMSTDDLIKELLK
jgi:hypothetical protein